MTTTSESTILSMLHGRASLRPDEIAFTFTHYDRDPAGVAESLTWSQLARRTMNVAVRLRRHGSAGDRAVILAPQGLEYILAFLWVAVLPGSAWPAVLALAMHNGGILGRLFGETLENLERRPLQALRTLGGSRGQITGLAAVPVAARARTATT